MKNRKLIGLVLLIGFVLVLIVGCNEKSTDPNRYAQPKYQSGNEVIDAFNGGFLVAGGDPSCTLMKTDASGKMEWFKTYISGTTGTFYCVTKSDDGGYVAAGEIDTMVNNYCATDFIIVKVNAAGDVLWTRSYGSPQVDGAFSIVQADDGFLVAGYTNEFSDDGSKAGMKVYKLDKNGSIVWEQTYNANGEHLAKNIIKTSDGNFVIAGSNSAWMDSGQKHDVAVLKINPNGDVIWSKLFGEAGMDEIANSVIQTKDGGYMLAGQKIGSFTSVDGNAWLIKLDADGNLVWDNLYAGTRYGYAESIIQNADGGYTFTGYTFPVKTDALSIDTNIWVERVASNGNFMWSKTFGSSSYDAGNSIIPKSNGGFVVAGYSYDINSGQDFYMMFLDGNGNSTR